MNTRLYDNSIIHEINLINNIDTYALDCYARTIALAVNSKKKYSIYSILLFMTKGFQGNSSSQYYIGDESIKIIYKKCNINIFYEKLTQFLIENKNLIIGFDQYFHKLYYNDYKKRHHFHYTLIKGYDVSKDEIIVIDEDISYSQEFPDDTPTYIERRISREIIKKACVESFIHHGIDSDDFEYITVEFTDENDNPYSLSVILSNYKKFLRTSLVKNAKVFDDIIVELTELKSKGLLNFKFFEDLPWVISRFEIYEKGYALQERVFNMILYNIGQYEVIRNLLKGINKHVRIMKLLLGKYIIKRNTKSFDILVKNYIPKLIEKETQFIYEMIKFIDENENDVKKAMSEAIDFDYFISE